MAALAEAFVAVRADTSKVKGDVEKGVNQAKIDESGKKTGHRWGSVFAASIGTAAGAGLIKFGRDSVAAFKESEVAQTQLSNAFAKFPQLADVSKSSLQDLNSELAKKTKFDDDATASGQAVLAQFKLTGTQVTQLTPLLQDYAAKTGKSLPDAAKDLGKAMLGQGRALKNIGLDFKDTGTATGNFNELVGGLRTQVGGFAEKEGKTAAGRTEILKNQFGELQETVGSKLVPILQTVTTAGLKVVGWLQKNSDVMKPLLIGLGVLIPAVYALNLALSLNPISLVVIGLAALGAGLFLAWKKSETFRDIVTGVFKAVKLYVQTWWLVVSTIFKGLVTAFQFAWQKAKDFGGIVSAVFSAIKKAGESIVQWFKDLPGVIARAVGTVTGTLKQKGRDLLTGLWSGIKAVWADVSGWFSGLVTRVRSSVGDTLWWLKQKGRDVLTGFLSGLKAVWEDIKKWVGGIATWIKDHKGPVSLDRNLLVPAGRAIMQGFFNGLKSGAGAAWDFVASVGGKTVDQLRAAVGFVAGGFTGGSGSNIDIGRAMAAQVGWVGDQWKALFSLWTRESGWNNLADNPTSTAFGIPQFINSTAAAYGVLGDTDPRHQIAAGISYIRDAYGTPLNAWQKWLSRSPHWYEQGAWDIPSLQLGVLHPHEMVVPAKPAEEFRRGAGGGVIVQFSNCTFAGTSKAQFTDLVVEAVDRAKLKRRI